MSQKRNPEPPKAPKPPPAPQAAAEPAAPGAAPPDELALVRARLDEAVAARQRALADFANYQRRALDNEARARHDAVAGVARSLIGVLDHFDLALGQDAERLSLEQLLAGVRIARG